MGTHISINAGKYLTSINEAIPVGIYSEIIIIWIFAIWKENQINY
jgi:hypothetical protein